MRLHGTALLCLLTLSSAAVAADKPAATSLTKLYQSYENAGNSALSMAEYDTRVRFSAVVLDQTTSMDDTPILQATEAGEEAEYARLMGEDEAQSKKLGALKIGAKFTATCTVGFSSGTDYLSLKDCTVE
ncbi:hypothetical protein [Lysobacter capsici]|uniref:hypothetical protein n=1 Tax=Lysobacter capsici TaxID=435897 RepID=UPI00287B60F2|nr:hypothetical protein [Lysobacter capsici]WND81662.1 hypothetical protein RJ610_04635 [Lysobacter capsici]WND86858.1 hypothetical protein RJ609_04635 [Lysobacter capsici]